MACLKMVLDYYASVLPARALAGGQKTAIEKTPALLEMCERGQKEDGYSKSGWFHEYILKVAQSYGLKAERGEKIGEIMGLQKIHDELKAGHPVIVSITKHILGQTKFHMVVLTGYEENDGIEFPERKGQIIGFYFNDPESLYLEQGKDIFVDIKAFKHDWRRMAIFIKP